MTEKTSRWIGVDLHSNKLTAYYLGEENNRLRSYSIEEMEKFERELQKGDIVAVEASTNTFCFAREIKDKVKEVYVVDPIRYGIIHKTNKKTDKIDAKKLAYGAKYHDQTGGQHLPLVYVPEEKISELRCLFTTYLQTGKKINMTRNRIHSILKANLFPYNDRDINEKSVREEILSLAIPEADKFQIELLYEELDLLYGHKDRLEEKIKSFAPTYEKEVKIIVSVTGVSILTSLALKADYADVNRFSNSRHFTSYLRTAPCIDESNSSTRIGSVNKNSRKLALGLLIQGLPHYWESNETAKNFREKKIQGKSKGKVRIAMARKLMTVIYCMLKRNELYRYTNNMLYEKKLREFQKITEKST